VNSVCLLLDSVYVIAKTFGLKKAVAISNALFPTKLERKKGALRNHFNFHHFSFSVEFRLKDIARVAAF